MNFYDGNDYNAIGFEVLLGYYDNFAETYGNVILQVEHFERRKGPEDFPNFHYDKELLDTVLYYFLKAEKTDEEASWLRRSLEVLSLYRLRPDLFEQLPPEYKRNDGFVLRELQIQQEILQDMKAQLEPIKIEGQYNAYQPQIEIERPAISVNNTEEWSRLDGALEESVGKLKIWVENLRPGGLQETEKESLQLSTGAPNQVIDNWTSRLDFLKYLVETTRYRRGDRVAGDCLQKYEELKKEYPQQFSSENPDPFNLHTISSALAITFRPRPYNPSRNEISRVVDVIGWVKDLKECLNDLDACLLSQSQIEQDSFMDPVHNEARTIQTELDNIRQRMNSLKNKIPGRT